MTYTRKPARKKRASGTSWSHANTYRGTQYRSTWETYVAKLLLYSGIEFQYEPRRFKLTQNVSYLPDFYLPDYKCYIEVKGWLLDKDKIKIDLFKTRITQRFVYLGKAELEGIFGGPGAKISKLDFSTYVPSKGELLRFQQIIQNTLRGIK